MKKLFTYLGVAVALSACTDNAPLPPNNESQQTSSESNSSVRSINDAINIANTLAEAIDGSTNSRATHRRASTAKDVYNPTNPQQLDDYPTSEDEDYKTDVKFFAVREYSKL